MLKPIEPAINLDKIKRQNLFTAYACCEILIKSKDQVPPYKSITGFITGLSDCILIDLDEIRKLTIQQIGMLKKQILNKLYK